MTETALHEAVAKLFAVALPPEVVAFHIRNERKTGRIAAARAGILPGICDWEIIDPNVRPVFIELKPEGWRVAHSRSWRQKKLTKHEARQLAVHDRLQNANCAVFICETLDEVIAACRAAGLPLRVKEMI